MTNSFRTLGRGDGRAALKCGWSRLLPIFELQPGDPAEFGGVVGHKLYPLRQCDGGDNQSEPII